MTDYAHYNEYVYHLTNLPLHCHGENTLKCIRLIRLHKETNSHLASSRLQINRRLHRRWQKLKDQYLHFTQDFSAKDNFTPCKTQNCTAHKLVISHNIHHNFVLLTNLLMWKHPIKDFHVWKQSMSNSFTLKINFTNDQRIFDEITTKVTNKTVKTDCDW